MVSGCDSGEPGVAGEGMVDADKHFTADNEPQAIRDWVDEMSFMHDDLGRWVHVAVDYQLSTSTSRSDLDAAAETVHQDLGKAEADASAVQRG